MNGRKDVRFMKGYNAKAQRQKYMNMNENEQL